MMQKKSNTASIKSTCKDKETMKNIYQIKVKRNGVEHVSHEHIDGDIDELHIVSMRIKNQELADEMAAIERANSFRNVQLPWIVVGSFTVFFTYVVMHSWRLI